MATETEEWELVEEALDTIATFVVQSHLNWSFGDGEGGGLLSMFWRSLEKATGKELQPSIIRLSR